MPTLTEARSRVGEKVVYRAPHVSLNEPGEEGVITSVGETFVYVRYGADVTSKATPVERLWFIRDGLGES